VRCPLCRDEGRIVDTKVLDTRIKPISEWQENVVRKRRCLDPKCGFTFLSTEIPHIKKEPYDES